MCGALWSAREAPKIISTELVRTATISSSSPCVHAVDGSWHALRRAIVNSCRSSRGPCTTVGDGRNDEAPGCGRTERSESESGVEVGVVTGPRSVFAAMGAGTLGWGSRSTSGQGSCSVPGPGTSRRTSRGGDSSGMYRVEDVSKGRVLVRGGVRDWSDVMRSVMMRGRRWRPGDHPGIGFRIPIYRKSKVQDVQGGCNLGGENVERSDQVIHKLRRQPHGKRNQCKGNTSTKWLRVNTSKSNWHVFRLHQRAEYLLPCAELQRPRVNPDGRHAGMALTAGGAFGTAPRWSEVPMRFTPPRPSSPVALPGCTVADWFNEISSFR